MARRIAGQWNTGTMGSCTGITLIEVGGASACGGLEAEGQEYCALCLRKALLNEKYGLPIFDTRYSNIDNARGLS